MSYLLDLVKTFDEAEMQIFRQIDLIGKEELLRDVYASQGQEEGFDEAKLPNTFNLSLSHVHKINSVLLNKAISALFGDNYMFCFTTLVKRGLTELMLHELRIAERTIMQRKVKADTSAFYVAAFEALCAMFHPNFNVKLTQLYGKKYLDAIGNKATIAHKTYVAMRLHQSTMVAQALAGNEEAYRAEAFSVIQHWEKKLKHTKSKIALFHFHFTRSAFVKFYGSDANPFLESLEKCKHLLNELSNDIQREYSFRVYCELAFGYAEIESYKTAELNFDKAFSLPYINSTKQSYQSGSYMNVCLINKNYRKASLIFESQLKHFLGKGINNSLRFDVLVNALTLFLHTKKFEMAFNHLQLMKEYKRNEITLMGQILLRICETLYFYCCHDYKMAAVLARRNMRFMKRPENLNLQFTYHSELMHCLYLFSRQKGKGLQASFQLIEQKKKLRGSMYNIFNQLL